MILDNQVESQQNAALYASGEVSGDITANKYASVHALGDVSGDIDGMKEVLVLSRGGKVSGNIRSATGHIIVFALDNISASLTAGKDIYLNSRSSIIGTINGGGYTTAITSGTFTGTLTSSKDVYVNAYGGINADITSTNDSATIVTCGAFTGSISAKTNVLLIAESASGELNAHEGNIIAYIYGRTASFHTCAANDVYIFSSGNLNANIKADDFVYVYADSAILNIETNDLFATAISNMVIRADASGDIIAESFGGMDGSVHSGGSTYAWAYGSMAPFNVEAGEYVTVICWSNSLMQTIISGDEGAYVWTRGTFNGTLTSANGSANLFSNGVFNSNITVSEYVVLDSLGDITAANITSGKSTFVTAFAGMSMLAVSAGEYAEILSERNISANVSAKNIRLLAYGAIRGRYLATGWFAAYAYSDFNASINAGEGISFVYARGTISGDIHTEGDIGLIYSCGNNSATISAASIYSIKAYIPDEDHTDNAGISGLITAAERIDHILADGEITAEILAPEIGEIISNDESVENLDDPALAPASIRGELVAEIDEYYTLLGTEKEAILEELEDIISEFKDIKKEIANEIATARNETIVSTDESKTLNLINAAQFQDDLLRCLRNINCYINSALTTFHDELIVNKSKFEHVIIVCRNEFPKVEEHKQYLSSRFSNTLEAVVLRGKKYEEMALAYSEQQKLARLQIWEDARQKYIEENIDKWITTLDSSWWGTTKEVLSAIKNSLANGVINIGIGIGNFLKEAGFYFRDIGAVGLDAILIGLGFEGYGFKEWSSIGKMNNPSSPDFVKDAFLGAGRAGLAGGTLGISEISFGIWGYYEDGDADKFQQHMGSVAGGNLTAAGGIKIISLKYPNVNPEFAFRPTPGSGAHPILFRPSAPTNPVPLNQRALESFKSDPNYGQLIESATNKPVAGKPGQEIPRTYEMVIDKSGMQYIEHSGHIPGKMTRPKTLTFSEQPSCGLPRAVASLEANGGTLHTVVKGGVRLEEGKFYYYPPCKHCTPVFANGFPAGITVYAMPNNGIYGLTPMRPLPYIQIYAEDEN